MNLFKLAHAKPAHNNGIRPAHIIQGMVSGPEAPSCVPLGALVPGAVSKLVHTKRIEA